MCQDNSGGEGGVIFSTNGAGTIGYPHTKSEVGPLSHILHQNELKWIIDINVRAKIIKL